MKRFEGLTVDEIMALLLDETHDDELMELWNDYCEDVGFVDDRVYYNDEDTLSMICDDFMSLAQRITYGNYNYSHEYVKLNGYANLESADLMEWLIHIDDLAEWLHEKGEEEKGE